MGILVLVVAILPAAGRRRFAGLQGGDRRPDEGVEADAAHRGHGEGALCDVLRHFTRVLLRLPLGRHVVERCLHAHVLDDGAGRLLVARRELRLLEFAADRVHGGVLHDAGGLQLLDALPGVAAALADGLPAGSGEQGVRRHARCRVPVRGRVPVLARRLSRLADRAALRDVQRGVHRDDDRLCQHRLQPVADLRAGADAVPVRIRHAARVRPAVASR